METQAASISVQGCVLVGTGDTSAAVPRLTLGIAALRSTGATLYVPWLLSNLARAHGDLGELDNAWRCIDEAMTVIQASKERWFEAEANRIAGQIALKSPEPDAAKAEAYFGPPSPLHVSNKPNHGNSARQ